MNDEKDKKGVGGVERAQKSSAIKQVDAVEEVTKVQKTERVGKTRASSGVGATSQQMDLKDRDKLLGMVDEEAEKLFANSKLPPDQKKVIREAVKMAIDSSLIPEEEDEGKSES